MSVSTTADDELNAAASNVKSAIASLHEVLINTCSGWDDYTHEYKKELYKIYAELVDIRSRLDR